MALINLFGIEIPLEWVILVAGVGGTLIFTVLLLAYKYFTSQSELSQPSTFVWSVEASGLTRIIQLGEGGEDASHLKFKLDGTEYQPSHHHPLTPVGTSERIHIWPIGSAETENPETWFGNRNMDSPTPLLVEKAHWEHEAHSGIGSAVDLFARHWPTFVLVGAMCFLAGLIVDAKVIGLH